MVKAKDNYYKVILIDSCRDVFFLISWSRRLAMHSLRLVRMHLREPPHDK
jgi:hypothetical protein